MVGMLGSVLFLNKGTKNIDWRIQVWKDTVTMIKERPVLGHGVNTYMRILEEYNRDAKFNPTYAHNSLLQLAAEIGILGLFYFLYILKNLFQYAIETLTGIRNKEEEVLLLGLGLFSGVLGFLVHSLFDTNLYSLQLVIYFWYMAGILVALCHLMNVTPSGKKRK